MSYEYISRRNLRLELVDRRSRGRAMRRYIDVAKKDMKAGGVREEDREDAVRLMQIFGSAND